MKTGRACRPALLAMDPYGSEFHRHAERQGAVVVGSGANRFRRREREDSRPDRSDADRDWDARSRLCADVPGNRTWSISRRRRSGTFASRSSRSGRFSGAPYAPPPASGKPKRRSGGTEEIGGFTNPPARAGLDLIWAVTDLDRDAAMSILGKMRKDYSKLAYSPTKFLEDLTAKGLPKLAARARAWSSS